MSRSSRAVGAFGVGYISQALMLAVGLWLTPFLLHRLGQQTYGLWLITLQITAYLSLLDLGVVALLPRETAYAVGRAGTGQHAPEVASVVGRTIRIVLWQLPVVALVAAASLLFMPQSWTAARGPLAVALIGFTVMFPLRVLQAVLDGLQELPYLGTVSLATWVGGTALTIGLVMAGFGLYAVALGWMTAQLASAALWWHRVHTRHADVLPKRLPPAPLAVVLPWIRSGLWVSVGQVAQVLLNGTDLFVIGKLLGPAAVVPYAVTGKLAGVLANQPQMIMQIALPGLSELRSGELREPLTRACLALSQLMLLVSGAVVCVVLTLNHGFVAWWVSDAQYGGFLLTELLLLSLLLRHWGLTVAYTLYAFGYERRLAFTALVDGIVTLGAAALLTSRVGIIGGPLGLIVGACTVSLPANVSALVRAHAIPPRSLLRTLAPWFCRFAVLVAAAVWVGHRYVPNTFAALAVTGLVTAGVYAAVMLPVALRGPLGVYVRPRVPAFGARIVRAVERAGTV